MKKHLFSSVVFSTALTWMAMSASTAAAQSFRIGHKPHQERVKKLKLQARQAKQAQLVQKLQLAKRHQRMTAPMKLKLDNWTEVDYDNNRKFRYVYGYDKDKNRTSETIYLTTRENGVWGSESLLTIGTYSYEYNTQGKPLKKTVTYTPNEVFSSYFIEIQAQADGSTLYVRYEQPYAGEKYVRESSWVHRVDGTLAEMRQYDNYMQDFQTTYYSPLGEITGWIKQDESGIRKEGWYSEGQLNDSTLISFNSSNQADTISYKYNALWGRLAEVDNSRNHSSYVFESNFIYEFDKFGRIVKIVEWNPLDDEEVAPIVPAPMSHSQASATQTKEVIYPNQEVTTFDYASDEVYAINNPWRMGFGFEGPLNRIEFREAGEKEYVETTTFTRDTSGKLLAVKVNRGKTPGMLVDTTTVTVNDLGQIIQVHNYFKEEGADMDGDGVIDKFYESQSDDTYTWENNLLVRINYTGKDNMGSQEFDFNDTTLYEYLPNGYKETDDDAVTQVSQVGKSLRIVSQDRNHMTRYYLREVQDRDLKFYHPNAVATRYDGFTPEVPVVVSVNNRVVGVSADAYSSQSSLSYRFGQAYWEYGSWGDELFMANMGENYLSVSEENGQTVCRDLQGLPIYVLEGEKLLKEYKYYLEPSASVPTFFHSTAEIQTGSPYELTTYTYNEAGVLTGKRVTFTDEDGKTEEMLQVDYTYDLTGIVNATANSKVGATLNGRSLSIGEGLFTVATLDGRILANNVSAYILPAAGVYVITAHGASIKVYVK